MTMDLSGILRRVADLHGEEEVVACGDVRLTGARLAAEAAALARSLLVIGVNRGDRVAILHRNCHRFLKAALGTAAAGIVLVPLNARLDAASLGLMLRDSGATVLLTEEKLRPLALAASARASDSVKVLDVDDLPAPREAFAFTAPSPDDLAQIYYTSGTTGSPRGVMLLHRNIASHALMTVAELGLSDRDVWAHVAPMFHLADAWAVFAITWVGGRHVFVPDFAPDAVLDAFERDGVTLTNLVPTMLNRIVAEPGAAERRFPALRAILSGGAPIAPSLVARILSTFRTEYVQTYGLTETSPYLTFSRLSRGLSARSEEERLRYVCRTGRPALGVDLRVVGDDGADVPQDDRTVGEIRVRAPWVTPGYWRNPGATAEAFADGWFRTGDLAVWNAEGWVNIVDRRRDMIITGGEKVYSTEVEALLAGHPDIFECAVVGVPDADFGEKVSAAIVPRGDAAPAAEDLRAFLRERLASFKVPRLWAVFGALPKTGSGKLRKTEIREALAAHAAAQGLVDLRRHRPLAH